MPPKATRPAPEDVLLIDVLVLMEGNGLLFLGASLGIPFWRALRTRQWLCLAKGESTLVRAGNPELDRSGDPVISAWVSCRPAMLFNTHDLKGMNPEVKASLDRLID